MEVPFFTSYWPRSTVEYTLPPMAVMSGAKVKLGATPQEENALICPPMAEGTMPCSAETVSFLAPAAAMASPSALQMETAGTSPETPSARAPVVPSVMSMAMSSAASELS